jgi:putative tryptophan/tyrosine transport system ATP-binding protein
MNKINGKSCFVGDAPLPLLSFCAAGLAFAGMAQPILQQINYEVAHGDFVVLLGSNGSGKSSLLKMVDRRYPVTAGQLMFAGCDIASYSQRDLGARIITLTQNCLDSLFGSLTVLENCLLAQQRRGCAAWRSCGDGRGKQLRHACVRDYFADYLQKFSANLAHRLDAAVNTLSGGEQQTLVLALSVMHQPQLLLLDEHTSALDPQVAARLMKMTAEVVRRKKITCILSTHDLEMALQYGDRILALHGGKVLRCIEREEKRRLQAHDLLALCY